MSGDTMVIGAVLEDSSSAGVNGDQNNNNGANTGAAYVFVRIGDTWIQQAYLKASNPGGLDGFGEAVAISGDTIVVGASGECSSASGVNGNQNDNSLISAGAAYVFVRNGTNWSQQAYLKASNPGEPDRFGVSVGVSGDTVVVGAYGEDSNATGVNGNQGNNNAVNSGAAYVFVRNGTVWSQQAYLKASNTGEYDLFGSSVQIWGETVVVGAPGEDANSGAAYVFVRDGTTWSQQAFLKASNAESGDQFGRRLTVSEDTIMVGAPFEDSNATGVNGDESNNDGTDSGAAYVFVRNGTQWDQQAYFKGSVAGGGIGWSLAISGDLAVAARHVFTRLGTNWTSQLVLAGSNTESGDSFGHAVAVAGSTVVISAIGEDSDATGVNGCQFNNGAPDSGAAYVFADFVPAPPRLAIRPDGGGGFYVQFTGVLFATYRLQRAPTPSGPWTTSAPLVAPDCGPVEFWEAFPPAGSAFYRLLMP